MRHLMLEPDEGAAPGLWIPGWVNVDESSYPVSEISEDLLRDRYQWVDVYETAFVSDGDRGIDALTPAWHRAGFLLSARANAELLPRGFAVWPAWTWAPDGLVTLEMRADFRENRLDISEARMQRLIESSNELLALHNLPLISAKSDHPPPTHA
jgi:hypothetical protein